MSKRKHRVRRGGIAVIPIVISIIFSLLIPVNVTAESFFASLQVIIGVWATLLGFIITTVSSLLTFTGSKLTEEIKATGHYKTILFSYLLTCFELLIFLLLSLLVHYRVYSGIMVKVLIAGVIISLTDIFICLFFLTLVIYTLFK
ncbi:MAG: hypothetical protein ACLUOI_36310 [Eisenbergiella sp.]